jgi:hypothetical protein
MHCRDLRDALQPSGLKLDIAGPVRVIIHHGARQISTLRW